jgi:diguanylate cyclase (GGDEF)-like protein
MPAGDGAGTGAFLATVDITALKEAEAMLSLQATHDALTGLPNRRLLFDRLSQAVVALGRHEGSVAVLYMDLDRFKPVNDELGHDAGDRLLQVIAGRIQTVVRGGDTVARVGGDEFVVVLTQLPAQDALARGVAAGVADKIVRAVGLPVDLLTRRVTVGVSVGVALCGDSERDPDALLRDADAAMYLAKRQSGARYTFFDDEIDDPQVADRLVAKRHHSLDRPAS